MTNKTPIEKAAAEAAEAIENGEFDYQEGEEFAANLAERFRRRLAKEVPPRKVKITERISASDFSYNHCRRDIGLRDEEETEA